MEIIDIARQLGQKLTESDEYNNFCKTRDKMRDNKELKVRLEEFKIQKSVLDIEKEKPDAEQSLIDAISARVDELYEEITNNPDMKAYNQAEEDLNLLMTAINMTITSYISPENLANNATMCEDDENCTHNCSTCSGCH